MNTDNQKELVLVWDFPVRVFHWLLVVSFVGAWATSESEAQQMIHYAFGYSAIALVVFRLVWGVVGTRYARFTQFIKRPSETMSYIKSLLTGKKHIGLGHNPAGAFVMTSLMTLILLICLTGYWIVKEFLGDVTSEVHEIFSSLALMLIVIHVAGAITMSFLQKENLIKSMITGKKQGFPNQAIKYPMNLVGLLLGLVWAYVFYLVLSSALPALIQ
jgi:cytochrome b